MTISVVQIMPHQSASNLASKAGSFGVLPTIGNAIFVLATCWNNGWGAGEVTDNQSHAAYGLDVQQGPTNAATAGIYSLPKVVNSSGTFTATVNPSAANDYFEYVALEVTGLNDTVALDQTQASTGTNTLPVIGSPPTTTQADELWLGVVGVSDSAGSCGLDLPAGWTVIDTIIQNASATIAFMAAYKIVSATGVLNFDGGTLSQTPSAGWAICAASYKGASGVAPAITHGRGLSRRIRTQAIKRASHY